MEDKKKHGNVNTQIKPVNTKSKTKTCKSSHQSEEILCQGPTALESPSIISACSHSTWFPTNQQLLYLQGYKAASIRAVSGQVSISCHNGSLWDQSKKQNSGGWAQPTGFPLFLSPITGRLVLVIGALENLVYSTDSPQCCPVTHFFLLGPQGP